jgi:flagellar biosynthesis/type III secretory pathway chaperone
MPANSSAQSWEHDIAQLLTELSQVQDELLEVLSNKRTLMVAGDTEAMAAMQPREEQLCTRLENCHERRRQLLESAAAHGRQVSNLEQLASTLESGKDGKLRRRVKQTAERMRLLQHQSLTNWVLAQRALLHLSQMLEIIATGGRLQPTYGKDRAAGLASGALVDRDA